MKAVFKQNLLLRLTLTFALTLSAASSYAQESTDDFAKESLGDAALVAWSGLGGAVLGLSTLSFASEPKEHLKNIYVGASVGIIIGVGLVAYLQANKARSRYDSVGFIPLFKFDTDPSSSPEEDLKEAGYGVGWTYNF